MLLESLDGVAYIQGYLTQNTFSDSEAEASSSLLA